MSRGQYSFKKKLRLICDISQVKAIRVGQVQRQICLNFIKTSKDNLIFLIAQKERIVNFYLILFWLGVIFLSFCCLVSQGNWRLIQNGNLRLGLASSLILTFKSCKDWGSFDPWLRQPEAIICWRTLEAIRLRNLDTIDAIEVFMTKSE